MKVRVTVSTRLHFSMGNITGEIVVDPDSLISSIYYNSLLNSRDPMMIRLKKLVSATKNQRIEDNIDTSIILKDGVVDRNYIEMNMLDAVYYLASYVGFFINTSENYEDPEIQKLMDLVSKYKDVEFVSQMANIK